MLPTRRRPGRPAPRKPSPRRPPESRNLLRAAGLALAALLAHDIAQPQSRASLDAGVSRVAYEGFLPSAAVSLTPALQIADDRFGLAAYGSWLRFESGNNSLQGSITGSAPPPYP